MFNDIVTIYNQHKVDGDITWYGHVLKGVECQPSSAINMMKEAEETADKVNLHIPDSVVAEKYLKPKEWMRSEDKVQMLTLAEGDFFIQAEMPEGAINDSDYDGGFFEHMKTQYDDVFNITSVQYYKAIPHFEVGGN